MPRLRRSRFSRPTSTASRRSTGSWATSCRLSKRLATDYTDLVSRIVKANLSSRSWTVSWRNRSGVRSARSTYLFLASGLSDLQISASCTLQSRALGSKTVEKTALSLPLSPLAALTILLSGKDCATMLQLRSIRRAEYARLPDVGSRCRLARKICLLSSLLLLPCAPKHRFASLTEHCPPLTECF